MPNSLMPHALASTEKSNPLIWANHSWSKGSGKCTIRIRNNDTQQPHKTVPFGFQTWLEQTCHPPLQKTAKTYSWKKVLKQICSRTTTLRPTWTMSSKNYLVAGTGTIHGPNQICYFCKSFWYKIFRLPWIFFGPVTCEHVSAYNPWFLRKLICTSGTGGLFAILRLTTVHLMCLTVQNLAEAGDG